MNEFTEIYPGLKKEDLCEMNTEYSCVICANSTCKHYLDKNRACQEHKFIDPFDWPNKLKLWKEKYEQTTDS